MDPRAGLDAVVKRRIPSPYRDANPVSSSAIALSYLGSHIRAGSFVDCQQLTPWSWVLPETLLTVTELVKKFTTFYGTRRFVTVFKAASHCSLSWAIRIQSTPSHPVFLRYILILPSLVFVSDFPTKKCTHFSYIRCMLHSPPISSSTLLVIELFTGLIPRT
jgi:hypothetical protein